MYKKYAYALAHEMCLMFSHFYDIQLFNANAMYIYFFVLESLKKKHP